MIGMRQRSLRERVLMNKMRNVCATNKSEYRAKRTNSPTDTKRVEMHGCTLTTLYVPFGKTKKISASKRGMAAQKTKGE